ncbi:MAG: iron ABC transporter permease [Coriobacteriia bacterium]|nr:iron ABC transporter permease [Coriobacteriia bacterium]
MTATSTEQSVRDQYSRSIARRLLIVSAGIVVLMALAVVALCIGSAELSAGGVIHALATRLVPSIGAPAFDESVVWELRLPRIVMAIIGGAGLAVSGAQMQGITKNPLVSPFTVGISSAAAFGASVAIMFGLRFVGAGTFAIIGNAFLFAMVCALLVFGLASLRGTSPETLILAGIALSYLFSALTSIIHFFASEEDLMAMIHWTFGTLTGVKWPEIAIVAAVMVVCVPILVKYSWDINAMALGGDDAARSLGVDATRVRIVSLLLSALITATIISFTGIIGFVCLVSPHIARYLIGGDHRFLLPASCIVGAIVMVASDVVGRTIISPIILPIGIVTSLVGVPLFLYLLLTRRQDYWG